MQGKSHFWRLRESRSRRKVLAASMLLTRFPTQQSRENSWPSRENMLAMQMNSAQDRGIKAAWHDAKAEVVPGQSPQASTRVRDTARWAAV
jgi:hypothetical protein